MTISQLPIDRDLAIKQLWQNRLESTEKIKRLESICNINGNLKSILENLTKELKSIPGSSISTNTGGSAVVDPSTINHELLGGLLGGAPNDHQHLTTTQVSALHPKLHDILSSIDHTSSATPGKILKADANGLPLDATNTDAEVAVACALKDILTNDTGFLNNENIVVTGADRKITLTGTGWSAYYKGVHKADLITGWESIAHGTDTSKRYFLVFDGTDYEWKDL